MKPSFFQYARVAFRPQAGRRGHAGLTLVELLVTISIIAILASIFLGALQIATEEAKAMKTKSMIVKLNNLIMPRYEAYRTRRVPLNLAITQASVAASLSYTYPLTPAQTFTVNSQVQRRTAQDRLDALHDLMRMELPDRWSDITSGPMTLQNSGLSLPTPSLNLAYQQAFYAVWGSNPLPTSSTAPLYAFQGAECLYMIVSLGFVDELGGRDLFNESNVGDIDKDGFPEFQDAWGMPIRFLRWTPGFAESELNGAGGLVVTTGANSIVANALSPVTNAYAGKSITLYSTSGNGIRETTTISSSLYNTPSAGQTTLTFTANLVNTSPAMFGIDPDPFDPTHVYPIGTTSPLDAVPFAIYPLIYSGGPDKTYGVNCDLSVTTTSINCFPFFVGSNGSQIGGHPANGDCTTTDDANYQPSIQAYGWFDNIHNHLIGTK